MPKPTISFFARTLRLLPSLLLCANAIAAPALIDPAKACRRNPARVAPCFTLKGRVFLANGTPAVRIASGKRLLGVVPAEQEIMPEALRESLGWDHAIQATLRVCPFTRARAGEMQQVCVESATDLRPADAPAKPR